ncbi:unnamed protein product [Albugo candida]|uniref:Uncharacterized protein n=1 Tax=Albugo candida TaxID=65357 RepID=A0A024FTL3_9STRA|nr:unnamed protein product [Albugo candida]|eukprot:CCI10458.1 unnamed protein product [Albugo candida]
MCCICMSKALRLPLHHIKCALYRHRASIFGCKYKKTKVSASITAYAQICRVPYRRLEPISHLMSLVLMLLERMIDAELHITYQRLKSGWRHDLLLDLKDNACTTPL